MLKTTYGAGYRAGFAEPVLVSKPNGLKEIAKPANPYAPRRFVSHFLWEQGAMAGQWKRVMGKGSL